jgi:hypothetical protein
MVTESGLATSQRAGPAAGARPYAFVILLVLFALLLALAVLRTGVAPTLETVTQQLNPGPTSRSPDSWEGHSVPENGEQRGGGRGRR